MKKVRVSRLTLILMISLWLIGMVTLLGLMSDSYHGLTNVRNEFLVTPHEDKVPPYVNQ